MAHIGRVNVMTWMRKNVEDHRDHLTDEVNDTTLAEDACREFNAWGPPPDYDIPEIFFEWAFLIAEEAEGKGCIRASVGGLINSLPSDYF